MNIFLLFLFTTSIPSLAQAAFTRSQIILQQMDCVGSYVKNEELDEFDPCYNGRVTTNDDFLAQSMESDQEARIKEKTEEEEATEEAGSSEEAQEEENLENEQPSVSKSQIISPN